MATMRRRLVVPLLASRQPQLLLIQMFGHLPLSADGPGTRPLDSPQQDCPVVLFQPRCEVRHPPTAHSPPRLQGELVCAEKPIARVDAVVASALTSTSGCKPCAKRTHRTSLHGLVSVTSSANCSLVSPLDLAPLLLGGHSLIASLCLAPIELWLVALVRLRVWLWYASEQ